MRYITVLILSDWYTTLYILFLIVLLDSAILAVGLSFLNNTAYYLAFYIISSADCYSS